MMTMILMFWEFFKIGLFAVGGGPATLPYLMDLTEKYDWYTMKELTDMIAISESTPGPLGVNMSTYAGFTTLGLFGGLVSTIGLVIPSIIVIILIAKFLANFSKNKYVKAVFWGLRPAVTALIAVAVLHVWKASLFTAKGSIYTPEWGPIILGIVTFGLMQIPRLKKGHPALWLLAAAVVGVIFRF